NEGLSSRLSYLDGVIFSSGTCDSLKNLAEIWQSSVDIEIFFLSEPAKLDRDAVSYFSQELWNLIKKLEAFQGEEFSKKAFKESIEIYNENRLLLSELYKFRLKHPEIIPYSEIFYVVVSSQILPKEQHNCILKEILSSLGNKISSKESGIPLFISGSYLSSPRIFEWIEDLGGCVISDDLSCGSRYFDFQIEAFGVETLAASYLKKIPNPVKFDEGLKREKRILDTVEGHEIRGVIFVLHKFCESNAFDYVRIKNKLKALGVETLLIETDNSISNEGQVKTRIQSFLEMIQ
ncbi:MAG: 2-hydroxyacyl-CoA dehydratase subunit D, partial [Candidatus Methanofastidiosia archaeon]